MDFPKALSAANSSVYSFFTVIGLVLFVPCFSGMISIAMLADPTIPDLMRAMWLLVGALVGFGFFDRGWKGWDARGSVESELISAQAAKIRAETELIKAEIANLGFRNTPTES